MLDNRINKIRNIQHVVLPYYFNPLLHRLFCFGCYGNNFNDEHNLETSIIEVRFFFSSRYSDKSIHGLLKSQNIVKFFNEGGVLNKR